MEFHHVFWPQLLYYTPEIPLCPIQMQKPMAGGNKCEPHKWENTEIPKVWSDRSSLVIFCVRVAPELVMNCSSCKEENENPG